MDNGSNSSLNVYPSIDAIAEVKVLTSNYGAQYGRSGSGTVEVETKSGTSQIPRRRLRVRAQPGLQCPKLLRVESPALSQERFRLHHGRADLHSEPLQHQQAEDFLLLVAGVAQRKRAGPGIQYACSLECGAQGNFTDLCPNQTTGSFADCPIDPGDGQSFPQQQVPVDATGAASSATDPSGELLAYLARRSTTPPRLSQQTGAKNCSASTRTSAPNGAPCSAIPTTRGIRSRPPRCITGSYFPTVQTNFVGPAVSIVARLNWNPSPSLVNEFVFSYTTDHITFTSTGTPNPNAWQRPPTCPWVLL